MLNEKAPSESLWQIAEGWSYQFHHLQELA